MMKISVKIDYKGYADIWLSVRKNYRSELARARNLYETFKNEKNFPALKAAWKDHLACAKFYKQILSQL